MNGKVTAKFITYIREKPTQEADVIAVTTPGAEYIPTGLFSSADGFWMQLQDTGWVMWRQYEVNSFRRSHGGV